MTEIRNIILIGRTGNGKSTVANVITGTDKFKESEFGVSETKGAQAEIIEDEGIKYRIVDTIGIGDTQWSTKQVLFKIAEAVRMVKEGVNQVFFVTSGRFTKEEIEAYNLLRTIVFDQEIVKYTTVVRTRFPKFQKVDATSEDKKKLEEENRDIADVIMTCNKVIYVDNPPINTGDEDVDGMGHKIREKSRKILLIHALMCDKVYKPGNLNKMNKRIEGHMDENEKQAKAIEGLEEMVKTQEAAAATERERLQKEFANLEEEQRKKMEAVIAQKERDIAKNQAEMKRLEREAEKTREKIANEVGGHIQEQEKGIWGSFVENCTPF